MVYIFRNQTKYNGEMKQVKKSRIIQVKYVFFKIKNLFTGNRVSLNRKKTFVENSCSIMWDQNSM